MSYDEDGYEIIEGIIPPMLCDALKIQAEFHDHLPHIPMAHMVLTLARTCMGAPRIVEKVEELIGKPSALTSEYFFGKPGTKGFNYHQDNKFIQAPKLVSCWIALTDVDPSNGCLLAFPGSHRGGLLPTKGKDPENRVDPIETPKGLPKALPMCRGDAIFFDGLLVHGSFDNNSDRRRESLTIAYIPRGAPFNPGKYGRVEIPV